MMAKSNRSTWAGYIDARPIHHPKNLLRRTAGPYNGSVNETPYVLGASASVRFAALELWSEACQLGTNPGNFLSKTYLQVGVGNLSLTAGATR